MVLIFQCHLSVHQNEILIEVVLVMEDNNFITLDISSHISFLKAAFIIEKIFEKSNFYDAVIPVVGENSKVIKISILLKDDILSSSIYVNYYNPPNYKLFTTIVVYKNNRWEVICENDYPSPSLKDYKIGRSADGLSTRDY